MDFAAIYDSQCRAGLVSLSEGTVGLMWFGESGCMVSRQSLGQKTQNGKEWSDGIRQGEGRFQFNTSILFPGFAWFVCCIKGQQRNNTITIK